MREGPLAELFRATEAAQRRSQPGQEDDAPAPAPEPLPDPDATQFLAPPSPVLAPAPEPDAARAARWLEPLPENPARLERVRDGSSYGAVIRVVGVGGAGMNALDRMMDAGITQVEFIAVNTDIQQLQMSDAPTKIHIGSELTEGLGSGSDPELGRL